MKQCITSIVCLLTALFATAGAINKSYQFSPSEIEIRTDTIDGAARSEVVYNGLGNLSEIGMPCVPVKSLLFKVPNDATNFSITSIVGGSTTITLPDSIVCGEAKTTSGVSYGSPSLNDDPYPSSMAEITNIGYIGGDQKVVNVCIHPVIAGKDRKSISVYSNISITLSYSIGNDPDLTPITSSNSIKRSELLQYVSSIVENPQMVETVQPNDVEPQTVDQEEYDYIIITPERFVKKFERLAAMRRTQGFGAEVFSLEYALGTNPGDEINDDAGKLRSFIKKVYETYETRHVLLAGRYPEMPLRFTWLDDLSKEYNDIERKIPTDIYFADLNSKWVAASHEDTYTVSSSNPDFFAEVTIGRLNIGENPDQEIDNYINKIKRYEFTNPVDNPSYYGQAFFSMQPAGRSFYDGYYEAALASVSKVFNTGLHNFAVRSNTEVLKGSQVINFLNSNPVGCLAIYGHGNPGAVSFDYDFHAIVGMDEYEFWTPADPGNGWDNLETEEYPSWLFSVGCFLMPHDYFNEDGTPLTVPYNFGDAYTIANPSGGVAFFGNTRASLISAGRDWSYNFFKILYESSQSNTISYAGDLSQKSMNLYTPIYNKREHYVKSLLGDPLCRLYVQQPISISATETSLLENGNREYSVNSGSEPLYVTHAPIIDATYSRRYGVYGSTKKVTNYLNELTCVYTSSSAPNILPLFLKDFEWWQYSSPYVFADSVFIGIPEDLNMDNVFISSGMEATIESLSDVTIGYGLYIRDNATLNIIADGTVSFTTIHMGENATLNITAKNILYEKGWAINDGSFNFNFNQTGENQKSTSRKVAARTESEDYTPMVVEGRTWWQEVEGRTGHFLNKPYVKHELGLSIGSEVMIDGVKWNKVYLSTVRNLDKVKDGVILDEDEGLLAYIREQDRKVYCKLLDSNEYTGRVQNIFGEAPVGLVFPWYVTTAESRDDVMLIYDFNRTDVMLGTLDTEWEQYGCEQCRYVSDCEIQNSGRTYRSHKFFHVVDQSVYDDEVVECVEGIGMTKSVWLGHNIFFLPLADPEFTALQPMLLRYVTDKDNNIIFEQEGGTKLWTEVSGVGNVSADRVAEGETLWYNLQGVRVDCPTMPGVYIQKSGNSTKKVMVK